MNLGSPAKLAAYELLFELVDEGAASLEAVQFGEAAQISAEVEELRAITDQVNADASGAQSLMTVGYL